MARNAFDSGLRVECLGLRFEGLGLSLGHRVAVTCSGSLVTCNTSQIYGSFPK